MHREIGGSLAGARNEQARAPAGQCEHDHQKGEAGGIAPVLGGNSADDGAEQDGNEGRAFHQRVAGRQLGALKMVGQDAVLDRTEQGGDDAEQEQCEEQEIDRVGGETDDGDERHADLGELEPPRHDRLVVAVGKLAAQGRQEEVRRDENGGRQRDQRFSLGAPDVKKDEKDQRVLEEVVAEGREELGPEQGRETPCREQGRGHWAFFR